MEVYPPNSGSGRWKADRPKLPLAIDIQNMPQYHSCTELCYSNKMGIINHQQKKSAFTQNVRQSHNHSNYQIIRLNRKWLNFKVSKGQSYNILKMRLKWMGNVILKQQGKKNLEMQQRFKGSSSNCFRRDGVFLDVLQILVPLMEKGKNQ